MKLFHKHVKNKNKIDQFICLHIQKTAGTSFGQFYLPKAFPNSLFKRYQTMNKFSNLEEAYSSRKKILKLNIKQKSNIKILFGHQVHLVLDLFPNAKLITFVRHPVDRVISQYLYERKFLVELNIPNRKKFNIRPLPEEMNDFWDYFLEWGKNGNFNLQSRTILNFFGKNINELESIFSEVEKFSFIGSQNQFEESILKLNKIFNFPIIKVPFLLRESNLVLIPDQSIKKEIVKNSAFDMFVYEFAVEKYFN